MAMKPQLGEQIVKWVHECVQQLLRTCFYYQGVNNVMVCSVIIIINLHFL